MDFNVADLFEAAADRVPDREINVEPDYDITRWSELDRGGHFAALEEPDLLVDDIRAFFRPLR